MDRYNRILELLKNNISFDYVEIVNESHLHKGHGGDDGSGESHFRITIVSEAFNGLSRVERHKKIYSILVGEIDKGLHAIALKTLTSQEFSGM